MNEPECFQSFIFRHSVENERFCGYEFPQCPTVQYLASKPALVQKIRDLFFRKWIRRTEKCRMVSILRKYFPVCRSLATLGLALSRLLLLNSICAERPRCSAEVLWRR